MIFNATLQRRPARGWSLINLLAREGAHTSARRNESLPMPAADGATFGPIVAQRNDLPFNAGDYDYWRRAIYELKSDGADDRFLKLESTGAAQISRVEIPHAAK